MQADLHAQRASCILPRAQYTTHITLLAWYAFSQDRSSGHITCSRADLLTAMPGWQFLRAMLQLQAVLDRGQPESSDNSPWSSFLFFLYGAKANRSTQKKGVKQSAQRPVLYQLAEVIQSCRLEVAHRNLRLRNLIFEIVPDLSCMNEELRVCKRMHACMESSDINEIPRIRQTGACFYMDAFSHPDLVFVLLIPYRQ